MCRVVEFRCRGSECQSLGSFIEQTPSRRERQMQNFRLGAGISMALLMGGVAAAQPAKPTDPQIAHIAYTAGAIDIKAAELALKKLQNPQVRSFAEDMVRDHKAVNEQALALVKKLNVTPQNNDTSKALVKQADAKEAELSALDG